ncbi:Arabinogalactan protein 16/20/22/41 [Dioscorea alata]|uniref:Arabinogalactan protein 16/20/22/41 n=1 Tax=Dioscorea alata TaxID=55571 RepID=A0ACB7TTF5_DIOAL|nr:Arabinogalactan protein 16/20/22/41 [Dioscorea alata]
MRVHVLVFLTFFFLSGLMQMAHGQSTTTCWKVDGKAIDQGIAYVLMLVALLVTYILH